MRKVGEARKVAGGGMLAMGLSDLAEEGRGLGTVVSKAVSVVKVSLAELAALVGAWL